MADTQTTGTTAKGRQASRAPVYHDRGDHDRWEAVYEAERRGEPIPQWAQEIIEACREAEREIADGTTMKFNSVDEFSDYMDNEWNGE